MAKKNKKPAQPQALSLKSYIVQHARKLEILQCMELSSDMDEGMKQIMVIRQRKNGTLIAGFYLIDSFCLGLKDTFYLEADNIDEINERVSNNRFDDLKYKTIDANYAFNFIYGAIEYAEDLGLLPHDDFKITEYILDDVDDIEFIDIEFGKNGRPFFMPGPSDNVQKIRTILNKQIGEANYDFIDFNQDEYDGIYDEDDDSPHELVFNVYQELNDLDEIPPNEFEKKLQKQVNSYDNHTKGLFTALVFASLAIHKEYYGEDGEGDDFEAKYKENPTQCIEELAESLKSQLADLIIELDQYVVRIAAENIIRFGPCYLLLDHLKLAMESSSSKSGKNGSEIFLFLVPANEKREVEILNLASDISDHLYQNDDFINLNEFQKNRVANVLSDLLNAYDNNEKCDQEWEDIDIDDFIDSEFLIPELRNDELKSVIMSLEIPSMD